MANITSSSELAKDRSFSIPHLLIGMTGGFQPDKLAR